ncbi:STAS-like domain-containing protein [Hymenobacter sediminicola]|uniref:DUF4325 domain-containing protein n=1 Tax=Hymenobacter sediminicola TaxID=2761579 RepID=A0A7G7W756_9BACT|nr:DUF4325 domain-containing protein [Hymenobacter sediminicola]QNH62199.1 DUF4325 domain-containing protein [Hymenobacter sediminicola]
MSNVASDGVVLNISDITPGTYSNVDGLTLLIAIKNAFDNQAEYVTLSLQGVIGFSSSFLNSSLGTLYEEMGIAGFKRIRLVNYKPAQLVQLKKYMTDVVQLHKAE